MSTRKVAAAEGMPEINRRTALVAGASLAFSAVPAIAKPLPEHPWVKARRLATELSAVLSECDGGAWMAEVYPSGAPWPVQFIDSSYLQDTAERRLKFHAKQYAKAAREIDPTAQTMWMGRAIGDIDARRFQLVVSREA